MAEDRPLRKERPAVLTAREGHPIGHDGKVYTVVRIKGRGRRYKIRIANKKPSLGPDPGETQIMPIIKRD